MCIFCKQSISEPRRTVPEVKLAEENHAIIHAYEYFNCLKCKHEWSSEFSYEVYSENESALKTCKERMRQCGFTRER